jgi:hypothetical protein
MFNILLAKPFHWPHGGYILPLISGLPSCVFPSGFHQNPIFIPIFRIRYKLPAHFIILGFFILIILVEVQARTLSEAMETLFDL